MKLKINTTNKNGLSNQIEIIQKIKEAVEMTIRTGERHEVEGVNLSSDTALQVVKALNNIKGVKRAEYGCLSHEYGLGGIYGTGITIYLDNEMMPTIQWQDDGNYLVNVHHFLAQFEQDEKLTTMIQETSLEDAIEYLEDLTGVEFKGDNTYNYSSDFTQDLNIWTQGLKPCEDGRKTIVLVAIHYGGDVRGNYGDYVAYRMDYDDYCQFLDFHYGFYNEKHEEYTAGYTREPQYHFLNDWEVLKINKETNEVEAKNKETGELATFSADVRF